MRRPLRPHELEILRLAANGCSYEEIQEATRYRNIGTLLKRLRRVFGAYNTTHMIAKCFQEGILKTDAETVVVAGPAAQVIRPRASALSTTN